jgi:adenylate kinase family enzyme
MSGYHPPTGEDDPMLVVRTIGRLAQMIHELRDEYVETRRDDTLDQLERRLDELTQQHHELKRVRLLHAADQ